MPALTPSPTAAAGKPAALALAVPEPQAELAAPQAAAAAGAASKTPRARQQAEALAVQGGRVAKRRSQEPAFEPAAAKAGAKRQGPGPARRGVPGAPAAPAPQRMGPRSAAGPRAGAHAPKAAAATRPQHPALVLPHGKGLPLAPPPLKAGQLVPAMGQPACPPLNLAVPRPGGYPAPAPLGAQPPQNRTALLTWGRLPGTLLCRGALLRRARCACRSQAAGCSC